jgi:hypothetical protein
MARGRLHGLAQLAHLGSLLLVSRCHVYGQQVTECVDGHVHLAASLALVAVVATARAALAARLQGTAVQDHRTGLALPARGKANHRAQVHDHGLEAARIEPAAALLVDRLPGREVVRQQSPRRTRPYDPAQGVENLPQAVLALRRVLGHQGKVGGSEAPFFVADISWIGLSWHRSKIRIPQAGSRESSKHALTPTLSCACS